MPEALLDEKIVRALNIAEWCSFRLAPTDGPGYEAERVSSCPQCRGVGGPYLSERAAKMFHPNELGHRDGCELAAAIEVLCA